MKILSLLLGFYLISDAWAQDEKVIYQYRKYERFDLGDLEVKGNLIAPGDISVRDRERKRFQVELYTRKEFEPFIRKDIESLR